MRQDNPGPAETRRHRIPGFPHAAAWGLLAGLMLLSACAPHPGAERNRFFWPPGPEKPRIEYINYYLTEQDAKRGEEDWLEKAIFGQSQPRRLFMRPSGIASDGKGRVFVTDVEAKKVYIFDLAGRQVRLLKNVEGHPAIFMFPVSVEMDDRGRAYVVDSRLPRKIHLFGADERLKKSFGEEQLERPVGMAVDSARQRLYVADADAHRVAIFDTDGNFLSTMGERGVEEGKFNFPLDVAVDADGNLYVLDSMNARIQVFDGEGSFLRQFGERGMSAGAFQMPRSLDVSRSGHLYVVDSRANRFVVFDLEGNLLLTVGGRSTATAKGVSPGGFSLPQAIDVDDDEAIWVVDSLNRMFHQFQYLNDEYLAEHPILPGQTFFPPGFHRDGKE